MRTLKQSTVARIVAQTGLPYESVFKFLYQQPLEGQAAVRLRKAFASEYGDDLSEIIRPPVSKAIGVILPEFVVDDYIGRVLNGMATVLDDSAYQATFHSIDMNVDAAVASEYFHALFSVGGAERAFIITYTSPSTRAILPFCEQANRPFLLMDHDISEDTGSSPALCLDNRQAIVDAMHYLFSLGHHRVGFITGLLTSPSAGYRLAGYKAALAEANLPLDPDLIAAGNWQVRDSADATRFLLGLDPRPTAIIASNDVMAISALSVLVEVGLKIPQDISLIGFDDIEMTSHTRPTLSTIRQPMARMGQKAIELAIALAEGQPLAETKLRFTTDLVIRDSTGLAPK